MKLGARVLTGAGEGRVKTIDKHWKFAVVELDQPWNEHGARDLAVPMEEIEELGNDPTQAV